MDTEEFALRLAVGVRAKRDADAARAGALVDVRSAFWNERGLLRGAEEVLAQMARARAPLRSPSSTRSGRRPAPIGIWATGSRPACAPRREHADAVGRLGPARFAVIAPRTSPANAAPLGHRLLDSVRRVVPTAAEGSASASRRSKIRRSRHRWRSCWRAPSPPWITATRTGPEGDVRRWAAPA